MSEFWVSQQKFYCKYCKVWIADNKPVSCIILFHHHHRNFNWTKSKSRHDSGVNHKRNLELFHKQKKEEKLHGAHSERELKDQLYQIERAAREAILKDRQDNIYQIEMVFLYFWFTLHSVIRFYGIFAVRRLIHLLHHHY